MIRVAKAREVTGELSLQLESVLGMQPLDYSNELQEKVQNLVPEYVPHRRSDTKSVASTILH
jgi:hypothetical protein